MTELEKIQQQLELEKAARQLAEKRLAEILSKSAIPYAGTDKKDNESFFAQSMPSDDPDPLIRIDRGGEIVFQNPAASKITHYKVDSNLYPTVELAKWIAQKFHDNNSLRFTIETFSEGNWYVLNCVLTSDLQYINVYGRNANEQVAARKNVEEKESLFYDIVENITGVVFQYHWKGRGMGEVNYVSSKLYSLFGLLPNDLPNMRSFLHPEDQLKWDVEAEGVKLGKFPRSFEGRLLHKDGSIRWIYVGVTQSSIVREATIINGLIMDIDAQKKAEEALNAVRERWRFAFEGSGHGMWEFDVTTGRCIFSRRYKENLGYDEHDWNDDNSEWRRRIHPEDIPVVEKSDLAYRNNEQQSHLNEYRLRCKDGSYKWVLDRGILLHRTPDGKPALFLGVQTIIDRQKQLELQLLSSATRLATVINHSTNGLLHLSEAGVISIVNDAFIKIFGLPVSVADLQGTSIGDALSRFPNHFSEADKILSNQSIVIKRRHKLKDHLMQLENGRSLSIDYIPIYIQNELDGHMFRFKDITEAWLAEQRLLQAEAKYRGMIENMKLGLVEIDNEQKIVYANQTFCSMSGYTLHELLGKRTADLYLRDGDELMHEKRMLRELGISDNYEIDVETKDGSRGRWLISAAPRYDDRGQVIGSLGISLDITNRYKLERELYYARYAAERASRVKDLFLVNVSHEIRTPLNAVIGMAGQLQKTGLDEQQKKYADVISKAAKDLMIIINDILDFSKIEAGQLKIELRPFKLAELIENVTGVMKHRAEEKGLLMYVDMEPGIPPVLIGDPFHINQVILNVLSNAIKFTEKGEVSLHCTCRKFRDNFREIYIEVRDTGIGMDKDFLEKNFEKFTTEDGTNTRPYSGTGLGLSITRDLVELMDGVLEVNSKKGEGTQVLMRLRLKLGQSKDVEEGHVFEEDLTILEGKRILVVEDNEMNQMVAESILSHNGVLVSLAGNGVEALEMLDAEQFDLVLMDMKMPVMDGLEATRKLRAANKHLPVIALTANALKGEEEKCLEAGMDDFITKPFEEMTLLATAAKWIKERQQVKESGTVHEEEKSYSLEKLEDIARGNIEFLRVMVGIFIADISATAADFSSAFNNNNLQLIHERAHKIKPSISNFCMPFVDEIKTIELLSLNKQDNEKLKLLISKFEVLSQKVVTDLQVWEQQAGGVVNSN